MKKKMKIVAAVPDVQYGLIKLMRSMIMFLLLGLLLLGGMESVSAQDGKVTLSGVVKDEAGNPLSEVTVQVKGTATGIFTNSEGKYTLETIQVSGILVFSFVGLQTAEVPYSGSGTYDVSMKSSTVDLDEVVVVGYGTQKMRNVTGAVATVKPEEISNLPVGNLGAALEGTVTGLSVSGGQARPGVGATLIIRQPYSLSKYGASQGPLYVIDDFITDENAFNNLDADEIESISVLKDAAAAIYGARSSQGAILVKTKHGKEGAPSISFSSQITYNA
jgi:TonB-dependent SusC/RagA subfamily outer membrane receptor